MEPSDVSSELLCTPPELGELEELLGNEEEGELDEGKLDGIFDGIFEGIEGIFEGRLWQNTVPESKKKPKTDTIRWT